ncbi:hypothetical protein EDD15DRAFT_2260508 [Pisolithus albus]|nr:hypothetical protein EDD15DRAFT_2260508 [Pisolithus albus]
MPDTSIVFQWYLESGKMINVYDWFEFFAVALEGQDVIASGHNSAICLSAMRDPLTTYPAYRSDTLASTERAG